MSDDTLIDEVINDDDMDQFDFAIELGFELD